MLIDPMDDNIIYVKIVGEQVSANTIGGNDNVKIVVEVKYAPIINENQDVKIVVEQVFAHITG